MTKRRHKINKKRMAPSKKNQSYSVSFRISPEMIPRLERYERHLRGLDPNMSITRAGLVRSLMERGLVDFELELSGHAESSTGRAKPVVHW